MNSDPHIPYNKELIEKLRNGTIEMISKGSFGITFKITSGNKKMLMKVGIIYDPIKPITNNTVTEIYGKFKTSSNLRDTNTESVCSVPTESFTNENLIHRDIYESSSRESIPLCPELYSYYILNLREINVQDSLLNEINKLLKKNPELIYFFRYATRNIKYGITFMEFLDGYETLDQIKNRLHKRLSKLLPLKMKGPILRGVSVTNANVDSCEAKYLKYVVRTMTGLVELALLGYNHADFHVGNIMFQKSSKGDQKYYPGLTDNCGRVMIIDFGQTVKLSDENIELLKGYYTSKDYIKILNFLYNSKRANDLEIFDPEYKSFYKYITGLYSGFHNKNVENTPYLIEKNMNSLINNVVESRKLSNQLYSTNKQNKKNKQGSRKSKSYTRENLMKLKELKQQYDIESEKINETIPCELPYKNPIKFKKPKFTTKLNKILENNNKSLNGGKSKKNMTKI